jgi:hypothetical protein
VTLKPFRALQTGESFFVDGAEYDVAAIGVVPEVNAQGVPLDQPELKYITLRNPVPKEDVNLTTTSVYKEGVDAIDELIPVLPPFNMTHDIVDDVDVAKDATGLVEDGQYLDNALSSDLDPGLIEDRIIKAVDPLEFRWLDETKEERFDTNLLEEKWTYGPCGPDGECWNWINIETFPWDYTEFLLPDIPDIAGSHGDYLLVSSFITEDGVRAKFAYDGYGDADGTLDDEEGDGMGLYVNTEAFELECYDFRPLPDGDGVVDILDLQAVADHWNTRPGDPGYDPLFDVDHSGWINVIDLQKVANAFGPCP